MIVPVILGSLIQIDFDHFYSAVAQKALQCVGVAAVSQEINGKGVTEAVDVGVSDASVVPQTIDKVAERITVEGCRPSQVVNSGSSGRASNLGKAFFDPEWRPHG